MVRLLDFPPLDWVVFEPMVGDAIRVCGGVPTAICKCTGNVKLAQSNAAGFKRLVFQTE